MIKFFRKIRLNLLSKGNTSKYFKYAIGEIILVVIGILIALQINNWNESKKEQAQLNGYLKNISKNIKSDIKNLTMIKNFRDSSRLGSKEFLKLTESPQLIAEDLHYFTSTYLFKYNSLFDVYFKSDKSGFEALKNSGYLNKIQETELETKIYNYYNIVAEIGEEEKSLNNFIEEMEYDMFKSGIVLQYINVLKAINKQPTEAHLKKAHELMNFPAFKGANFRVSRLKKIMSSYENAIDAASETVDLIAEMVPENH
ncbi:DUF6090 family protein [Psychroserpens algicola]|uniref:DUF6090 family protein n=1 Tax=Psychroserpens algicola TaxID=1719034 RepID=A0ABT0HBQ0_9FLAO|nr:DUF6090 family protein [Psychroserpens algicola]